MNEIQIDYVKNATERLSQLMGEIESLAEDCNHYIFKFEQDLNRHSYYNIEAFITDKRDLALNLYECNQINALHNAYTDWSKEHNVDALSLPLFEQALAPAMAKFTDSLPKDKTLSTSFICAQVQALTNGCYDKGCTLDETNAKVEKFCLNIFPNASDQLKKSFKSYSAFIQSMLSQREVLLYMINQENKQ